MNVNSRVQPNKKFCASDSSRGEQKAKTKLKLAGMDLGNFRAVLEGELGEF